MSGRPDGWIGWTTTGCVALLGGDRGHSLLPTHAHAGGGAWPAGVGGGTNPAVSGRDDRGRLDHTAGRLTRGEAWRSAAVGASCGGQRGEPGRQCRGRSADRGRAHNRSLAVIRAYRRL